MQCFVKISGTGKTDNRTCEVNKDATNVVLEHFCSIKGVFSKLQWQQRSKAGFISVHNYPFYSNQAEKLDWILWFKSRILRTI